MIYQDGSILDARWPVAGEINEILIKSSQYLEEAAHTFRVLLKNYLTPPKSAKNVKISKPEQGIIWVAKSYPCWQSIILTTMKEMYTVSHSNNITRQLDYLELISFYLLLYVIRKMMVSYQKIKYLLWSLRRKAN